MVCDMQKLQSTISRKLHTYITTGFNNHYLQEAEFSENVSCNLRHCLVTLTQYQMIFYGTYAWPKYALTADI